MVQLDGLVLWRKNYNSGLCMENLANQLPCMFNGNAGCFIVLFHSLFCEGSFIDNEWIAKE